MIMIALLAALVGGLAASFLRATCIQVGLEHGVGSPFSVFLMCMVACLSTTQLFLVNKAIEFYDQVEAIPIYQTLLIFNNMFCGAVILDEY